MFRKIRLLCKQGGIAFALFLMHFNFNAVWFVQLLHGDMPITAYKELQTCTYLFLFPRAKKIWAIFKYTLLLFDGCIVIVFHVKMASGYFHRSTVVVLMICWHWYIVLCPCNRNWILVLYFVLHLLFNKYAAKKKICSYQFNIWYVPYQGTILHLFYILYTLISLNTRSQAQTRRTD